MAVAYMLICLMHFPKYVELVPLVLFAIAYIVTSYSSSSSAASSAIGVAASSVAPQDDENEEYNNSLLLSGSKSVERYVSLCFAF